MPCPNRPALHDGPNRTWWKQQQIYQLCSSSYCLTNSAASHITYSVRISSPLPLCLSSSYIFATLFSTHTHTHHLRSFFNTTHILRSARKITVFNKLYLHAVEWGSQKGAVATANKLRSGRSGVQLPTGTKYFFWKNFRPALGPSQAPMDTGDNFCGSKVARVWSWPPSSAEVKNWWSSTSRIPIRLHGVPKDKFIFTT